MSLTPGILSRIVEKKHSEVQEILPRTAELVAAAKDAGPARGFAAALRRAGEVRLLAEVKRRSPSAGEIRAGANPAAVARAYESAGAAAVSVLTDREFFGGSLDALREVRAAVPLPVIRKDFIVDPVQVHEARAAGADAVLLIVRILEDASLRELHALAAELEMDVLVEVHDDEELERALGAGARLVGVNNRDLDTFTTDLALSLRIGASVPAEVTLVAESGIRTAADVDRLGAGGVDAVLVGESLMRQDDLRAAAAALVGRPKHDGARGG
ncbi:MAG TPA: indole-3-glycerol phosphate synthase TrpC [Longimicrobiaceae bacterium]|jgi:indole-3-glycerol phosphate synthase|nr:indole-3-glycerol phosphate synthase TrpC [Longimicrobiaceae bacterium]